MGFEGEYRIGSTRFDGTTEQFENFSSGAANRSRMFVCVPTISLWTSTKKFILLVSAAICDSFIVESNGLRMEKVVTDEHSGKFVCSYQIEL